MLRAATATFDPSALKTSRRICREGGAGVRTLHDAKRTSAGSVTATSRRFGLGRPSDQPMGARDVLVVPRHPSETCADNSLSVCIEVTPFLDLKMEPEMDSSGLDISKRAARGDSTSFTWKYRWLSGATACGDSGAGENPHKSQD